MIELDVYFFHWLGVLIEPIHHIEPTYPLAASVETLAMARVGLNGFRKGGELERAFPRTATIANEMVRVLDDVLPPIGGPVPDISSPVPEWQVKRMKAIAHGLAAALRDEAQRSYVLKVEDQRCLSSYSLFERMQDCLPQDCWATIGDDAKREFSECGKCLALERYTGAGFHALRGVECVIRQYIVKLTSSSPRKRDWGHYIEVLRNNNADPNLVSVLDNIRTLNRNPLMHPEDWLDIDDAVGIFNISQTAIVRLVAGIKNCP